MKKLLFITAAAAFISVVAVNVSAQRNPTMPSQQRDNDKEDLYGQFTEAKQVNTAEKQRLAYDAAKKFLQRFEGDDDDAVREARRFINQYESAGQNFQLYKTYSAKDYAKTFELGRAILKKDADRFYVLAMLAQAGYDSSLAGEPSLHDETIVRTRKAIQLLEKGKVTKPDPFKSVDAASGVLNFILGSLLKDQSPIDAAAALRKAAEADSSYRTDPLTYNLLGVTILRGEYQQLSDEYNQKFGGQQPSQEQRAMLQRINQVAARAMDAYARAVALSTNPVQQDARAKMLLKLSALYKTFHNDSDAGLNELIATVLSKPLP